MYCFKVCSSLNCFIKIMRYGHTQETIKFFLVLPKKDMASMQIFGLGQTRPVLQGWVDIPFAVFIAHYLKKIELRSSEAQFWAWSTYILHTVFKKTLAPPISPSYWYIIQKGSHRKMSLTSINPIWGYPWHWWKKFHSYLMSLLCPRKKNRIISPGDNAPEMSEWRHVRSRVQSSFNVLPHRLLEIGLQWLILKLRLQGFRICMIRGVYVVRFSRKTCFFPKKNCLKKGLLGGHTEFGGAGGRTVDIWSTSRLPLKTWGHNNSF